MTRDDIITEKVGIISERMGGVELTIDRDMTGYVLYEGSDYGGVSDSTFGSRRRTYGEFVDWLDAVLLGTAIGMDAYVS